MAIDGSALALRTGVMLDCIYNAVKDIEDPHLCKKRMPMILLDGLTFALTFKENHIVVNLMRGMTIFVRALNDFFVCPLVTKRTCYMEKIGRFLIGDFGLNQLVIEVAYCLYIS